MPFPSDDAIGSPSPTQPEHARAERPRAEPEIIPPGTPLPRPPWGEAYVFAQHGSRIHVLRPGPFAVAMLLLGAGFVGVIGVLLLLGAVLVGAAAIGAVVLTTVLSRLFSARAGANRRPF